MRLTFWRPFAMAGAAALTSLASAHAGVHPFGPEFLVGAGPQTVSADIAVDDTISGDATLTISVMGDFNTPQNNLTIVVETLSLGVVFDNNQNNDPFSFNGDASGNCGFATSTATIAEADLAPLIADGLLSISFTTSSGVSSPCPSIGSFTAPTGGASFGVSGVVSFTVAASGGGGGGGTAATPAEETTAAAQSLAAGRASIALANLPTLSTRLGGGGGSSVSGEGTGAGGALSFSTSLSALRREAAAAAEGDTVAAFRMGESPGGVDFWIGGSYTYYESDVGGAGSSGDLGMLQAGLDYRIGEQLVVGVFVMGDLLDSESSSGASSEGVGVMAGPYAVVGLAENIHLEGLLAAGRAFNDVKTAGLPSADFESDRLLVSSRLSGDWSFDGWRFSPSTRVSYYAERQEAFTDGSGAAIPEDTATFGQLRFGPEVSYDLRLDGSASVQPFVGVEGVWAFVQSEQTVGGTQVTPDDLSATVSLGFDASIGSATIRAAGRYDGLGADDFEAITGELQVRVPFN